MVVISSIHTTDKIQTVYADKGYAGSPNRGFPALNKIKDGIMRKDSKTAWVENLKNFIRMLQSWRMCSIIKDLL
jgi:IS5 family transposase